MRLPPDPRASDEWVPYVACLLAFFLLLQAAAFAGHSRVAVLVSIGVYFAATALVQGGPARVRLVCAAVFTTMLTLLGFGLGLVILPEPARHVAEPCSVHLEKNCDRI